MRKMKRFSVTRKCRQLFLPLQQDYHVTSAMESHYEGNKSIQVSRSAAGSPRIESRFSLVSRRRAVVSVVVRL